MKLIKLPESLESITKDNIFLVKYFTKKFRNLDTNTTDIIEMENILEETTLRTTVSYDPVSNKNSKYYSYAYKACKNEFNKFIRKARERHELRQNYKQSLEIVESPDYYKNIELEDYIDQGKTKDEKELLRAILVYLKSTSKHRKDLSKLLRWPLKRVVKVLSSLETEEFKELIKQ